jgi:hypothetical protein
MRQQLFYFFNNPIAMGRRIVLTKNVKSNRNPGLYKNNKDSSFSSLWHPTAQGGVLWNVDLPRKHIYHIPSLFPGEKGANLSAASLRPTLNSSASQEERLWTKLVNLSINFS